MQIIKFRCAILNKVSKWLLFRDRWQTKAGWDYWSCICAVNSSKSTIIRSRIYMYSRVWIPHWRAIRVDLKGANGSILYIDFRTDCLYNMFILHKHHPGSSQASVKGLYIIVDSFWWSGNYCIATQNLAPLLIIRLHCLSSRSPPRCTKFNLWSVFGSPTPHLLLNCRQASSDYSV